MSAPDESTVGEVTQVLQALSAGEPHAADALLDLVYADLRQMARAKMRQEKPGQTLQATALVHEAWLRLGQGVFENRGHFSAPPRRRCGASLWTAPGANNARKRGAGAEHCDLDEVEIAAPGAADDELLAVHEALDRLAAHDARKAEIVKLRYFVGLSFEETADVLGISLATANREWAYARAWLHQKIRAEQ